MTKTELMKKTKAELVEIVLKQQTTIWKTKQEDAADVTTCADCKNWSANGKYCPVLVRKTAPEFFCAKAK